MLGQRAHVLRIKSDFQKTRRKTTAHWPPHDLVVGVGGGGVLLDDSRLLNNRLLHERLCCHHRDLLVEVRVHTAVLDLASLLAQRARRATHHRAIVVTDAALDSLLGPQFHPQHHVIERERDAEGDAAAALAKLLRILAQEADPAEDSHATNRHIVETVAQPGRPRPGLLSIVSSLNHRGGGHG